MSFHSDLREVQHLIGAQSDGNPGAIHVMCAGVVNFGRVFFDRIRFHGLRGPRIWEFFKDECGEDMTVAYTRLLGDVLPEVKR